MPDAPSADPGARTGPRTVGGYVWFGFMVGGWSLFFALLAFSEPTLGELWRNVRDLPLVVEGLVWLLLFPFILAFAPGTFRGRPG